MLSLYYDAVQEMFDSLPRQPMPPRLVADMLLAAVRRHAGVPAHDPHHGVV